MRAHASSYEPKKSNSDKHEKLGKGVPACEAVPKVEGGWSGQAAEKKFWEAQILCVSNLTYFSIIYLKPAKTS